MPSRSLAAELMLRPDLQHEIDLRVSTRTSLVLPISLSTPECCHDRESGMQWPQGLIHGISWR